MSKLHKVYFKDFVKFCISKGWVKWGRRAADEVIRMYHGMESYPLVLKMADSNFIEANNDEMIKEFKESFK